MQWRSRALHLSIGERSADQALVAAYLDVFGRKGEAVETVLVDMANHSGFYRVEPPDGDLTQYQAGYRDGLRASFGRLFSFLTLTDDELKALEQAAREEARTFQP